MLEEEIAELVPEDELEEKMQQADQQIECVYSTIAKINKALGPSVHATPPPVDRTETVDPTAGLTDAGEILRTNSSRVVTPLREPT